MSEVKIGGQTSLYKLILTHFFFIFKAIQEKKVGWQNQVSEMDMLMSFGKCFTPPPPPSPQSMTVSSDN